MSTKPDYDLLERYIRRTLDGAERAAVAKRIGDDRAWFEAALELKEALLLSDTGMPATSALREKIQKMVKRERAGFVSILVTIVKEKITISSGDQSGGDFQGIAAEFALRGKSEAGPVTITRKIGGRTVTILLTPLKKKETFALSVLLEKKEPLTAKLVVDDIELEAVADVGKHGAFETHLTAPANADVVFYKKNKEEFTVNLKLRSESGR